MQTPIAILARRCLTCVGGFELPTPRRRTFAPVLQTFARSMLTALRHPWLRWSATPARGAWAPLRDDSAAFFLR